MSVSTQSFSRILNHWYRKNSRDLPWRETEDPYKIWVSEVMLQQTTVKAVIPYYIKWIKVFPTIDKVAKCSEQKLLKMWQGLGYYRRVKNLHLASKLICEQHNGKIPSDYNQLIKLPGFGAYTTGAVLSIAYDQRVPIIDANVRRVFMRQLGIKGNADSKQDSAVLKSLDEVMPKRNLRTFNQALMELGALVCKSKEPVCNACPVKSSCIAYAKGIQEVIPTPKKKVIKNLEVAIGVVYSKGRYFIQKRSNKGLLADLWEFPGGKIEKGESPQEALKRELMEEVGVGVKSENHLMNVTHYYTQYRVNLHVFKCQFTKNPISHDRARWVSPKDLLKFPMPSGSAKIVDKLLEKC